MNQEQLDEIRKRTEFWPDNLIGASRYLEVAQDDERKLLAEIDNLRASFEFVAKELTEAKAVLKRIADLTNEWEANRMGSLKFQRLRWQRLGEIAREFLYR